MKSNFLGTQISYFQFSRINKIVLLKSPNLRCLVMAAQTILTQTFSIIFLDGRKSKGIKNHLTSWIKYHFVFDRKIPGSKKGNTTYMNIVMCQWTGNRKYMSEDTSSRRYLVPALVGSIKSFQFYFKIIYASWHATLLLLEIRIQCNDNTVRKSRHS